MKKRIYLYNSGSLIRQDNSIVFQSGMKKDYLPIKQIDTINIFNHVNLNKNVIILLNREDIVINFFDYNGNYSGSFYPQKSYYGINIIKQVDFLNDYEKKKNISIELILSSFVNMQAVLKYYNKKYDLKNQIDEIEQLKTQLQISSNIEKIMLIEAKVKQIYYSCFDIIINNNPDYHFEKRSLRPPLNRVNAMMSYGYSLLYNLISNILYRSRLNINLPLLHGVVRSKEGLQYDIADVFKPVIIDRMIFRMINRSQLNDSDFNEQKGKVYMSTSGIKKFIMEYETLLTSTIKVNSRTMTYKSIISNEVHNISKCIIERKKYHGYKHKW